MGITRLWAAALAAVSLFSATAVVLGVAAGAAQAQTFPSKPLRIIVPFTAGGNADLTSRMLGEQLNKAFGQSVIVDNRPGAGAVIGYEIGAKAPPDGHTLLIVYPSFIINPSIRRVQYDPLKDLPSTPEQLALLLQAESARYSKTVKTAGIRAE